MILGSLHHHQPAAAVLLYTQSFCHTVILAFSHFGIQSFWHFGNVWQCFVIQSSCFHVTQLLVTMSSCDTVTSAAPPLVAKLSRHIRTLSTECLRWGCAEYLSGGRGHEANKSQWRHALVINVNIEEISSEIILDCLDIYSRCCSRHWHHQSRRHFFNK